MTNKKNQSHFFENDKSLHEFVQMGYKIQFDEYKDLKKSVCNLFNDSKLHESYKEGILFEILEQVRMNNIEGKTSVYEKTLKNIINDFSLINSYKNSI